MPLDVVITHALRTPMARAGTDLQRVGAVELGRQVVGELIARADLDVGEVDEVVLGCAGNPVDAANVARVVTLRANLPRAIPALTVQRNCGSGLEALTTAVERIRVGRARVLVAGGVESMSSYPLLLSSGARGVFERLYRARSLGQRLVALAGARLRHLRPEIGLEIGLTDPVCGLNMGETAEVLAKKFCIAREDQDEYALRSHQRACAAEETGRFAAERMPLFLSPVFDEVLDVDVGPRPQQSLEALGRLRPVFDRRHGTVTAGNSCMVTDGAAALLVMDAATASRLGYEPLGRVAGYAWAGLSPRRMGLGPCYATPRALDEAGIGLEDVDLVELNEAFAAQVLACQACFRSTAFARQELGRSMAVGELDPDRLNVNGGAIALGHPVGATGARIVVTILHEMARRHAASGLVTLCIGGGQGGALVLRR